MHNTTHRSRSQSFSDTHILHCGCTHCDGSGMLMHETRRHASYSECPLCEGHGYLVEETIHSVFIGAPLAAKTPVLPISNDYARPVKPFRQAA